MPVCVTNIDHGERRAYQCLTGIFFMRPTNLIGATTGVLFTNGLQIPVRQVPGPDLQGPPLASVSGQRVTLCGWFITDASGTVFNVQTVIPRPGATPGSSGAIPGTTGTLF